jgi:hypothetical protein
VELKAISGELGTSEEQQFRNYLMILNVKRGMLINSSSRAASRARPS